MWNNEAELNFLEIYQTEPVLWEPTHQFHKDKKKLHDAWVRISEQTGFPVNELKKKKLSLMATFRGHIRDINASLKSGAGCDEVHKPAWFAFELMNSFLGHLYKCKGTVNTVNQNYQPSASLELDEACSDANTTHNIQLPTAGTTSSQDPTEADIPQSFASPVIQRRRKNPMELQEAGKRMKDAMTTLNKVLEKQEVPEDDCDRYGKILANKLRKLPDLKRMQLMWEIDGLYIKTIQSVPFPAANQFVPSPSPSPTSYSVCSTYSEPITSQRFITPQASSYSAPSPILNDIDDTHGTHISESSQKVPSKCVTILSNKVIAPAQLAPASHSDDNIVHETFLDAIRY